MSKHTTRVVCAMAAMAATWAASWPAAADIATDQNSLEPFWTQTQAFGKLNRSRTAGASQIVSRSSGR